MPCLISTACSQGLDIVFALDSSSDVAEDQWKEQKDFMKKIAEGFQIQEDGTHAGVLAYSTIPSISMKLGERNARQELDKALDDLPRDPGNRNLVRNLLSTLSFFPTDCLEDFKVSTFLSIYSNVT